MGLVHLDERHKPPVDQQAQALVQAVFDRRQCPSRRWVLSYPGRLHRVALIQAPSDAVRTRLLAGRSQALLALIWLGASV